MLRWLMPVRMVPEHPPPYSYLVVGIEPLTSVARAIAKGKHLFYVFILFIHISLSHR